jgi:hypothetical protein
MSFIRLKYTVLILFSPLHQITIPAQQGNPNSVPRALTVQVLKIISELAAFILVQLYWH